MLPLLRLSGIAGRTTAGQYMSRRVVHFEGRVQGVGFRYTARRVAERFPVAGFVRNLADGRVQVVAEGSAEALDGFLSELQQEMADHISRTDVADGPASGEFTSFDIRL